MQSRELIHGIGHHTEADEQHSEAGEHTSSLLPRVAFGKEHDKCADTCKSAEDEGGGDTVGAEHTQRDQLSGNCRTDVRAVDDGCRLCEGHDSHVHKTDDHHSNGTTALDSSGADSADCHAEPFVVAGLGKEAFEPFR